MRLTPKTDQAIQQYSFRKNRLTADQIFAIENELHDLERDLKKSEGLKISIEAEIAEMSIAVSKMKEKTEKLKVIHLTLYCLKMPKC